MKVKKGFFYQNYWNKKENTNKFYEICTNNLIKTILFVYIKVYKLCKC